MAIYQIRPDRTRPPGWQILSVADIHFFVEPSFLIFIGIIMLVNLQGLASVPSMRSQAISESGLFGFIIFFSLLAHEAGHAIVARLFGYKDIYVSLVALGGRTLHPPATRGQSLLITLAGPAATLLLVGAAWGILMGVDARWMEQDVSRFIVGNFLFLNIAWAVFNLLPVFPMDGGRTLLYVLTYLMKDARALVCTALVSLAVCVIGAAWLAMGQARATQDRMILIFFIITFFSQNVQILREYWHRW